jgi:hypothetical protein
MHWWLENGPVNLQDQSPKIMTHKTSIVVPVEHTVLNRGPRSDRNRRLGDGKRTLSQEFMYTSAGTTWGC